jgi:hypothetical protein
MPNSTPTQPAVHLPQTLAFETNVGQAGPGVQFVAHGPGYNLSLTPSGTVLALHAPQGAQGLSDGMLQISLVGASPNPVASGLDPLPGKVNYLLGNDPSQWRTDISTFARVSYANVYPGIDAQYHSDGHGQLEYDFVVHPSADPSAVRLAYSGTAGISLDSHGQLILQTSAGQVTQQAPTVYQELNGARQTVSGAYALASNGQVAFQLGAYDPNLPLVIDPVLYSSYLGGSGDEHGNAIAVDTSGNSYIAGATNSAGFATSGAYQTVLGGGTDAFVTKISATGTKNWTTYIGGASDDRAMAIAVDSFGATYVTGSTSSSNFPTTMMAYQTTLQGTNAAFVLSLSASGSMLNSSTYLGGTGSSMQEALGIAVSGSFVYVTGDTGSSTFPTTVSAYKTSYGGGSSDAFVAQLSTSGLLAYSTFLGGSGADIGYAISLDTSNNAIVVGSTSSTGLATSNVYQTTLNGSTNAFVASINSSGSSLNYFTYLGGSGTDIAYAVWVDTGPGGNTYVAGSTTSDNFPVTSNASQPSRAGGMDAFVAALNSTATTLSWSTFYGGTGDDAAYTVALDSNKRVFIAGSTTSTDLAVPNGVQPKNAGGTSDGFVAEFPAPGSALGYGTYYGGSGADQVNGLRCDGSNNVDMTGTTSSTDFPTANAFQSTSGGGLDAFWVQLGAITAPTANADTYTDDHDTTLRVPAWQGVLANDTDPNGLVPFTEIPGTLAA